MAIWGQFICIGVNEIIVDGKIQPGYIYFNEIIMDGYIESTSTYL